MSTGEFSITGPLPRGHLAIQASAGTGKTYALAALATRFLAEVEGLSTADLLVVTFTRAATSELRARVRERLVQAADHLEVHVAVDAGGGPAPSTTDDLLVHLADVDAAERARRLERLQRAVTEFDAATITTIHGFATQVLTTLGITSGADPDAAMVDDSAQLAAECCADVLAAAALRRDDLPTSKILVYRTRTAINIPDLRLAPGPEQAGTATDQDLLLTELVRDSIERMRTRRRAAATLSFDDVLLQLRGALRDGGADAGATLRNRYKVALIDEFQDTDPVQWDIFRAMFPDPAAADTSLVLVGDPKQSIYAFRGANVHTYLSAVRDAPEPPASLGTNWRSDGAVLAATQALLQGTTFGDAEIGFVPVQAAPAHRDRRAVGVDGQPLPAVDVRLTLGPDIELNDKGQAKADEARAAIESDLVARVRALLDGARIPTDAGEMVRVQPSDIAVLVRSNEDATKLRDALRRGGIPAMLSRGGSVLDSPAADQWRWLLDAMSRPSDPARARAFALSWFGGRDADWVAAAGDEELVALAEQLTGWTMVLAERGVTDFQRRVWADTDVVARVLARPDGDRELTDLEHIAELLGTGAGVEHQSVAGLLSILDAPPPEEIDADIDRDQAARRVESEAKAVQIMTVWVAKGLEFPIVCVPTMWSTVPAPMIVPDPDGAVGARMFDLASKSWPDAAASKARKAQAQSEALGENLRLLYVALTRARHQTVLWWAPVSRATRAGLTKVLFARDEHGDIDPDAFAAPTSPLPGPAEAPGLLAPVVAASGGTISVSLHGAAAPSPEPWQAPDQAGQHDRVLAPARLSRTPDRRSRRWSFTAIVAGEHRDAVAVGDPTDPTGGDAGAADEPTDDPTGDPTRSDDHHTGALATLPAGATFGTLVHAVLEQVDFTSPTLDAELRRELDHQLERRPIDLSPRLADGTRGEHADGVDLLVSGLLDAVHTPMGSLLGDRRLAEFTRADRLDELEFDLRLGDSGGAAASDAELGAVIEAHLAPADLFDRQPLHEWASRLLDGRFDAELAGHLTGSIDAVLRTTDASGVPRFVVVDYKTNRLTPPGVAASVGDYHPDRLVGAMADHHYPLQALLYSVALHRYLRWRLGDAYDPGVHLGGVAYLFVRGMVGPDTPVHDGQRHGAFTWAVPPALVVALSDLLAGAPIGALGRWSR